MRRYRIGSAFGIPIKIDLTFLLVLPLFAYIIAVQVGLWTDLLNDVWGAGLDAAVLSTGGVPWLLGGLAALGLFAGIVMHELGHSLVAMRYGFPIDSITLWLFGGIAQLTEMPEDWRQELYIAIMGPVVSIALGLVSYAGFRAIPAGDALGIQSARFLLGYLAIMNVALAAFNLLPGFPMDGGRVLRALLARTRPYPAATRIAATVGKVFAVLLGILGLFAFNVFLIGIAFFIYLGATGEVQQQVVKSAFQGVTVREIMTPASDLDTVSPETSVADLLERMFRERHVGYPVVRDGDVVGVVTLEDVSDVAPVERQVVTVGEVMSTDLRSIPASTDVVEAMTALHRNGIGRVFVTEDGDLVGVLTRTDLVRAFAILGEAGPRAPTEGSTTSDPSRVGLHR